MKKTQKKEHSGKARPASPSLGGHEFPRISRFIPEKRGVRLFYAISFTLILASIVLISFQLVHDLKEKGQREVMHGKLVTELGFWRWISKNYSGYRDAYFHVAVLDYQLGDLADARVNLQKTLELDPNFQKARDLESFLSK